MRARRGILLALCLGAVTPQSALEAQGPVASLDSLQVMIGSWELVTYSEASSGDWIPVSGTAPADWSFGPANDGAVGGIDGVGRLSFGDESTSNARIEVRAGDDQNPVHMELTLEEAGAVHFVGRFFPGGQVALARDDDASADPTPGSTVPSLPEGMRLAIEARDRFVLVLIRMRGDHLRTVDYLLWEFRKHQTQ